MSRITIISRPLLILISMMSLALTFFSTSTVLAAGECQGLKTSIIDCDVKGGNPVTSIILQVVNFLAVGVGIAVVGGIIWGGMLYASSNGDASKTKQGITVIVNAVIGLLLFIFMYALLNFIVPGGVFS